MAQTFNKTKLVQLGYTHFGNIYDYSRVPDNVRADDIIEIYCRTHQAWIRQRARTHSRGHTGCRECISLRLSGSTLSRGAMKSADDLNADFVSRANAVHGDRYDYSKFAYRGATKDGTIVCRIHGEFPQTPSNHLNGTLCPQCSRAERWGDSLKNQCNAVGADYWRALKRRKAGHRPETVLNKDCIRGQREINPIEVFRVAYPNIEEAVRKLRPKACPTTIARWIETGASPDEAFSRTPGNGDGSGIIYMIICIDTGKSYIGQTNRSEFARLESHFVSAVGKYSVKDERSLHSDMKRFPATSFGIVVLEQTRPGDDIDEKEAAWIRQLNTLAPNGYNILKSGGNGGVRPKPLVVDGEPFLSCREADQYIADTRGISFEAARKRRQSGRIDVKAPPRKGMGGCRSREYKAWSRIFSFTTSKSKSYRSDVTFCDSWRSFDVFLNDVGRCTPPAVVLLRIDATSGYAPGNCKWATKSEASRRSALARAD